MLEEFIIDAEKSFISGWFIRDLSICDKLINHFEDNREKANEGAFYRNGVKTILPEAKISFDLPIFPEDEVARLYVDQLQTVTDLYKEKYDRCNITAPWGIESVNIQKYPVNGGFFSWHTEKSSATKPMLSRHLVFMTYLNDITDGGETEFLYQKVKIKPKKGLTLIWPSDWTHTHRGIVSPSQIKYIATGWYKFKD